MERLQPTEEDLIAFIKFAESRYDARNDAPDVRSHLYSAPPVLMAGGASRVSQPHTKHLETAKPRLVCQVWWGLFEERNPSFLIVLRMRAISPAIEKAGMPNNGVIPPPTTSKICCQMCDDTNRVREPICSDTQFGR